MIVTSRPNCSAEVQVIWGGIAKHLLIAYFIDNMPKMSKFVRVCQRYSKPWVGRFLGTRCSVSFWRGTTALVGRLSCGAPVCVARCSCCCRINVIFIIIIGVVHWCYCYCYRCCYRCHYYYYYYYYYNYNYYNYCWSSPCSAVNASSWVLLWGDWSADHSRRPRPSDDPRTRRLVSLSRLPRVLLFPARPPRNVHLHPHPARRSTRLDHTGLGRSLRHRLLSSQTLTHSPIHAARKTVGGPLIGNVPPTNISQGSVATRLRCGGIFMVKFAESFLRSVTVKECRQSASIWQNYRQ